MRKLKKDINKKDNSYSWSGRNNTVKMSLLPKAISRTSEFPTKISPKLFTELEQIILKLSKRP